MKIDNNASEHAMHVCILGLQWKEDIPVMILARENSGVMDAVGSIWGYDAQVAWNFVFW